MKDTGFKMEKRQSVN